MPNPARWGGHLQNLLPAISKVRAKGEHASASGHHAAMAYSELPDFMRLLEQRPGIAALALRYTILCAARTGEVTGMRWDEVNLAERLWVVPADRMKAGQQHRIPLSDAALEILRGLPVEADNPHCFVGRGAGRALSNTSMLGLLKTLHAGLTVHGFRSSFRLWCAERTAFPADVAEMALAHAVGSQVQRAYQRSDLLEQRRALMAQWAGFCMTPQAESATVLPFAKVAS